MKAYEKESIRRDAEQDAANGNYSHQPSAFMNYKARDIYDEAHRKSVELNGYGGQDPFHNVEDADRNIKIVLIGVGILAAILIAVLIAAIIIVVQEEIVVYAVKFQYCVYVAGTLTTLLMYSVGKGANKSLNILFYIGIGAVASRFFAVIVEMREGVTYINYVKATTNGFWYLAKYTLLYFGYIAVIVGVMMLITFLIRKKKSS